MTAIIFDVEATGLPGYEVLGPESQPHMMEFAAVKVDGGFNVLEELQFLLRPPVPIPAEVIKITGITPDMLENQLPFVNYLTQLQQFYLGVETLYAHNLEYDLTVLKAELERVGHVTSFPWPPGQVCTVQASLGLKGHRIALGDLYKEAFDEGFENAHRAMGDVKALLRLLPWLQAEGWII